MKKFIAALLCLSLLLCLCSCGESGNDLWSSASPSTSAMRFTWFDGSEGEAGYLYDQTLEQEILASLSKPSATPAEWSPELVEYPIYEIWIDAADGNSIQATWTNGYLLMRDGSAYKFNYKFSELKDYAWEDVELVLSPAFYNGRWLALSDSGWNSEYLTPAEHESAPENISLAVTAVEDGLVTALLANEGGKEWMYGEAFSLDVLLDGTWYRVPTLPTKNWGFVDIGYILPAGESREESYSLAMYGELPSGTYRLVVGGLTAEFTL